MNKHRPTLNRISWTTQALNFFMDIYDEIKQLKITKHDRSEGLVRGTAEDVDTICVYITNKLGVTSNRINRRKTYTTNYWYTNNQKKSVENINPVSDNLAAAFEKVGDLYIKHQHTWDNTEKVEDIASYDDNSDMKDMNL